MLGVEIGKHISHLIDVDSAVSFGEATVLCELFVKLALASESEHEKDALFVAFRRGSNHKGKGCLDAGGSVGFQSHSESASPLGIGQSRTRHLKARMYFGSIIGAKIVKK